MDEMPSNKITWYNEKDEFVCPMLIYINNSINCLLLYEVKDKCPLQRFVFDSCVSCLIQ
jgi:hypothetical protein